MLKLNGAWLCGLSSVPQGSGLSRLRSSESKDYKSQESKDYKREESTDYKIAEIPGVSLECTVSKEWILGMFVSQQWIYAKWQLGLVSNIYRCCRAHRSGNACVHSTIKESVSLMAAIKSWRGQATRSLSV